MIYEQRTALRYNNFHGKSLGSKQFSDHAGSNCVPSSSEHEPAKLPVGPVQLNGDGFDDIQFNHSSAVPREHPRLGFHHLPSRLVKQRYQLSNCCLLRHTAIVHNHWIT